MLKNKKVKEGDEMKIQRNVNINMSSEMLLTIIAIFIFISTLVSCYSLFLIHNKTNKMITLMEDLKKETNALSNNLLKALPVPPLFLKIGDKAPHFNLESIKGKRYSLDQFLQKKIVLLAWTSTCSHCENILPDVQKFYERIKKEEDIEFLSVVRISTEEERKKTEEIIKKYKLSFLVLLSTPLDTFGGDYRITSVPIMWIIGKTRLIEGTYTGEEGIKNRITQDLSEILSEKR